MQTKIAIQDQMHHNNCYGCGTANDKGLQIKSFWCDEKTTECTFVAQPHHCAGPLRFLNGGVIATVIDCHCICTAMAKAKIDAQGTSENIENIWYATGKLELSYLRPTILEEKILVVAKIEEIQEKRISLSCELINHGKVCVTAKVLAVRVPSDWF